MSFLRGIQGCVRLSTMAGTIPNMNKKLVVTKITNRFREATEVQTVPMPKPGPTDLLIRNRYAGVNASEINMTAARYDPKYVPQTPPFDTGFEGIGEVVATGEDCKTIKNGQAIAYVSVMGAFSEYLIVPERHAIPLPAVKAEYMPLLVSGLTASISLEKVGEIKPGEVVLVTAAAGGTGQLAVQLAKMKACHVIGTCSTDEKVDFLKSLGVDRVINYKKENIGEVLRAEYKKGVDVVYETIGGDVFDDCLTNLAIGGRLIVIGFIEGYESEIGFVRSKKAPLVQPLLLRKSASVRGFLMNHFLSLWPEHLRRLVSLYEGGQLRSRVDPGRASPCGPFSGVESVADAVDYLYSRKSMGKIIVEFNEQAASKL